MRNWVILIAASLFIVFSSARADLTIVQKVEGNGQNTDVTVKIKGDKERIDAPSQPTRIIDGKAGEMSDLMNQRKSFIKISAAQIEKAAESMNINADKKSASTKLTPTGKKETISGYETEEYTFETAQFKASFWVANKYPGAKDILKQMDAPVSGAWKVSKLGMPDYSDFSGVPLKTIISVGPNQVVTTIVSIKQAPLNASEFEIPKDFKEVTGAVESEPVSEQSPSTSPAP